MWVAIAKAGGLPPRARRARGLPFAASREHPRELTRKSVRGPGAAAADGHEGTRLGARGCWPRRPLCAGGGLATPADRGAAARCRRRQPPFGPHFAGDRRAAPAGRSAGSCPPAIVGWVAPEEGLGESLPGGPAEASSTRRPPWPARAAAALRPTWACARSLLVGRDRRGHDGQLARPLAFVGRRLNPWLPLVYPLTSLSPPPRPPRPAPQLVDEAADHLGRLLGRADQRGRR